MREKVFAFLIAIFLLGSLAPTFYEIAHSDRLPPIREFELVHNFPTDFNFYLSRIRQGIEGRTTVIEQYTSEPHTGSFLQVFYLALGWLGRWNRVPWERGGDVYHVARVVFGALLLVTIAEFCKRSFEKLEMGSGKPGSHFTLLTSPSVMAFLLAVTASTWPKLVAYVNNQVVPATIANITNWRFGGFMSWWSVMDSLQRITFIPHLLVGQTLILFLVMALSNSETMRKPGNWIFLGILAFAIGIIFPPGLLFVIATIGVLVALELFVGHKGIISLAAATKMIPLLLGVPSLLYLSLMTSFYPWKRLAEFDIVKPLPFVYAEYLKAAGPILPIGAIGLVAALLMREKRMLPAIAWVLAWALLLVVFKFIPQQSPLRFSEMIPHVPLGVLTAYVFLVLSRPRPTVPRILLVIGHWSLVIPAALLILGGGVMYSSYLWQKDFVDHKMRATYPLVPTGSYVMYPLKDFLRAMKYIQDATSRDTVILSQTTAGNYLPVMSGNTVYVGHANTVRAEEKESMVKEFFSGRMKPEAARDWLARENLSWIFFGPQEKEDGGVGDLAKIYPFLVENYKNAYVTIYRFP